MRSQLRATAQNLEVFGLNGVAIGDVSGMVQQLSTLNVQFANLSTLVDSAATGSAAGLSGLQTQATQAAILVGSLGGQIDALTASVNQMATNARLNAVECKCCVVRRWPGSV